MATFYPSLETIKQFKVPPTEGEWTLLHFLKKILDDSFEIYFNPFLNGDRPDVLIMRQGHGAIVIEVKDWNLNNFHINDKKKWVYTPNNSIVKSPIDQVKKYKENLFDLHVPELLDLKIKDFKHFNIVSCAIYFHTAQQSEIDNLAVKPFESDRKYQDFLKYQLDLIGCDSLNEEHFKALLKKHYMLDRGSFYFTIDLYNNFKRILSPSIHLKSQGAKILYSKKQKDIIYSNKLEQRVRGVFGSGKTTVLAARAVQAYKRALSRNPNPRILILTYNITLKNFIHDKLNYVDEEFSLKNFIIINYHQFINAELNNLNIDINVPKGLSENEISTFLEENYYGNELLFEAHKKEIKKYDAVLIDEIQDYHRTWMDIIKKYFRDPQGNYVLFGDVKQNIYGLKTEKKDVATNVIGVNELKYCYRSGFKIRDLAQSFQRSIFGDKYDADDFSENGVFNFMGQKQEKDGYINYMYLQSEKPIVALYNIIRGNITNKESNVSPNDITILGCTSSMLRTFDAYYRYASREKTNSMIESIETMYLIHLNYIGKTNIGQPEWNWYRNIFEHLQKRMFPNKKFISDYEICRIKQTIAKLFTIYDLHNKYSETLYERLNAECLKCRITCNALIAFLNHYLDTVNEFRNKVYNDNYKIIRDNKKFNFWMNNGTIKISTIHSFKGWESEVVFLIIEPKSDYSLTFDELLYTGLTRCKRDLVVINFGNKEYDTKIRPLIEQIK